MGKKLTNKELTEAITSMDANISGAIEVSFLSIEWIYHI